MLAYWDSFPTQVLILFSQDKICVPRHQLLHCIFFRIVYSEVENLSNFLPECKFISKLFFLRKLIDCKKRQDLNVNKKFFLLEFCNSIESFYLFFLRLFSLHGKCSPVTVIKKARFVVYKLIR